jgi:hypothetical protein
MENTSITFEGTFVHVRVSGYLTHEERLTFWTQVANACNEYGCFYIFGESALTKPLGTFEAFATNEIFTKAGLTHKHRIAWVVAKPENVESTKFAELVVTNRATTNIKVFTDAAPAKHWLLDNSDV